MELFKKLKPLEIKECPFSNLPEKKAGRWGAGLTAAEMTECCWLKPVLVGQFEFVEFTPEGHLRHSKFISIREDKKPKDVMRERKRDRVHNNPSANWHARQWPWRFYKRLG